MSGLLLSHNPGFGIHSFKLGLLYKEASIWYKRKKGDNEMQSSLASAENWFQDPKTCRRSSPLYTVMWCVCIGYSRVCLHITSFTSFEWNQRYCLAHGKFKVCFLELSGIFFPPNILNQWLVESKDTKPMDMEGQLSLIIKMLSIEGMFLFLRVQLLLLTLPDTAGKEISNVISHLRILLGQGLFPLSQSVGSPSPPPLSADQVLPPPGRCPDLFSFTHPPSLSLSLLLPLPPRSK